MWRTGRPLFTETDFKNLGKEETQTEESKVDTEEKKKLKETINVIQNEYDSTPERTFGDMKIPVAVEKKYTPPTLEETAKTATDQIAPVYDAKISTAQAESEYKKKQKQAEKDDLYERAESSLAQIRASANTAKENTSNQAMKRGLSRSSIVAQLLNDIENEKLSAEGGILKDRDKAVGEIDGKINEIDATLLNKISELSAEKSYGINEKIQDLLASYEKKKNEVDEYNNKIRQQKAEFIANAKAQGIDLSEENSSEYVKMVADKTKAFYGYYYSLGEDALTELKKDKGYITDHIGSKGYETLKRYFEK